MDSVFKSSSLVSGALTFIIAVLFGFSAFLIKVPQKKQYATIRIQLADNSVKKEEITKPVVETVPEIQNKNEAGNTVEKASVEKTESIPETKKTASAKKTEENTSTKKSSSAPAPKTDTTKKTVETKPAQTASNPVPEIKKSIEEQAAENAANKKAAVWDDSLFDDLDDVAQVSSVPVTASSKSGFEGSAGSAAASENSSTVTAESGRKKTSAQMSTEVLNKIARTDPIPHKAQDGETTSTIKVTYAHADGKTMIKTDNDTYRELLNPVSPFISLSEAAAAKVSSYSEVTIRFTITADGTVPLSTITITPVSRLPELVQSEIRSQISKWKFESDESSVTASFVYTIIVNESSVQ